MIDNYIFAIDIGSSSCRCAVYTDDCKKEGQLVHLVQLPVSMSSMGTFDADDIVRCVDSCVDKALKFLRNRSRFHIRAVGFDCFAMSLVGCVFGDGGGLCAVTPVYTYANGHPKKEKYTNELKRRVANLPPATGLDLWSLHQETGTTIHASYAAPQLLCLQQEQPSLFQQVSRWTTLTTYILSKWTGNIDVKIGISEASWTGLFDRRSSLESGLKWHEGLLSLIGMHSESFSEIGDSYCQIGDTKICGDDDTQKCIRENLSIPSSVKYYERWPEFHMSQTRLFLGLGDGAAANVGSKATGPKRIALTVGTSAAIRIVINDDEFRQEAIPDGLWCYKINNSYSLLGGALTDGGSIYKWLQETLAINNAPHGDDEIKCDDSKTGRVDALLQHVNQNEDRNLFQHNLTVLPFPNGERSPGWIDNTTGTITGIKLSTTPNDIIIAHLQGIGYRLKEIYDRLKVYLTGVRSDDRTDILFFCSGTALQKNTAWKKILADIFGAQLVSETIHEATSRGVYQMIQCCLLKKNVFVAPEAINLSNAVVFQENMIHHKKYIALKEKQDSLYSRFYGHRVIDCSSICSICMENLYTPINGLVQVIKIDQCQHVFHQQCLEGWKAHGAKTCPNCRSVCFEDKEEPDGAVRSQSNVWFGATTAPLLSSNVYVAASATAALAAAYLLRNSSTGTG